MQKQRNGKPASLLIREGACFSNVLRIKSSVRISEQDGGLIRISLSSSIDKLPEEIGTLARILVESTANIVCRVQTISFRPYQVILDLGIGNIWSEEEERRVRTLIDSLLHSRGLTTQWSAQRKIGQRVSPL